jgi:hypothetical protein
MTWYTDMNISVPGTYIRTFIELKCSLNLNTLFYWDQEFSFGESLYDLIRE